MESNRKVSCDYTGVNAPWGIHLPFAGLTCTWWGHGKERVSSLSLGGWCKNDARGCTKLDSTDLWLSKVKVILEVTDSFRAGLMSNHLI